MIPKKLLAELIGTFSLTLVVLLSATSDSFPFPVPIMAGLTVGLFVYTIGAISGTHLNPAVTLGVLSIKKIELPEAMRYIVAQVSGAILALMALKTLDITIPRLGGLAGGAVLTGEIVGTALLTFGIAAVVLEKMNEGTQGFIIGTSLFIGACVATLIGAPGFLNPAVAIGANSLSVNTLLGPIIGSVIGMQLHKFLIAKE